MSELKKTTVINSDEKSDDTNRIGATLAFIVVILLIGLPMWWKTTEVYRATLPYEGIQKLTDSPIKASLKVGIFIKNADRRQLLVSELDQKFRNHPIFNINFIDMEVPADILKAMKTPAGLEAKLMKKYNIKVGDFIFVEWSALKEDVLVTSERSAFISVGISSTKIEEVVKLWILDDFKIQSILGSLTTFDGKQLRHNKPPPQPHYDVLISVLNPRPDIQTVHWNVQIATKAYIEPFLEALRLLSNFTVKSQWKYQILMDHANKQVPDNSILQRHYAISEEHLPYVITALEKRLGNAISNHPQIHLVAYTPSCLNAPLHIYKKNGQRASANNVDAFTSPRWGSVIIVNPSNATCVDFLSEREDHVLVEVNSHEVMKIALYQLRRLFELERDVPIKGASVVQLESILPRSWEVDSYLRTGAIHLVHSAQSTLKSLVSLLDDINYIVISDEVGLAINEAYDHILLAKQCLRENDLENCVRYAKKAFVASERAFFDQSLLALLYFPDEQKYAIYIPLFLPIMIPVVLSINSIRKFLLGGKSKSDATKEKAE